MISITGKKWLVKNHSEKSAIDKILENRGGKFLIDDTNEFHDPFLFKDMQKVMEKIETMIETQERIIVFGDYDVDGITGTAIVFNTLKQLGANISCRIPHREKDGYGLSEKFIDEFIEKKIKLIITVDCGISCNNVITKAKNNGIETIITDHHTIPKDLPQDAYAILHPKTAEENYPFCELTGAGVALKLAQALIERFFPEIEKTAFFNSLVDLASLGTVADLGPLYGENKLIVKNGLKNLTNTKWIGLKKIMELSGVNLKLPLDTSTIGYRIAPRINAAGRIDSAYLALSLLLQDEESEKVQLLGEELEKLNTKRQQMTETALAEADEIICSGPELPYVLIAHNNNWHVGIVGLVAGKLADRYARPVIIMQDFGDVLVASARSPEYFNIIEAITHNKEYLESFGGHSQAAGFSIKKSNLATFQQKINEFAGEKLKDLDLVPIVKIDCEINKNEIDFSLLNKIDELQPFGSKNEKPVLLIKNMESIFLEQLGKDRKHLKFLFRVENTKIHGIAFNFGKYYEQIRNNNLFDIVFHLDRNIWNQKENLQLQIVDLCINENK